MLILYSKPGCVQCDAVKRWLKSPDRELTEGVHYVVEDAREHIDDLVDLGYMRAPVLYVDEDNHWSGFDTTKLENWRVGL